MRSEDEATIVMGRNLHQSKERKKDVPCVLPACVRAIHILYKAVYQGGGGGLQVLLFL